MIYTFSEWIPAFPLDPKNNLWGIHFNQVQNHGYWLFNGHPFENWDPEISVVASDGPDCSCDFMFAENGSWPVFSKSLQQLLNESFPGCFQFLPFSFSPESKSYRNQNFALGQCLHRIDGLDKKRTKADNDDWTPLSNGTLPACAPYCLIYERVKDLPAFRIIGIDNLLFVRSDVQQAILESGMNGSRFLSDEVFCSYGE